MNFVSIAFGYSHYKLHPPTVVRLVCPADSAGAAPAGDSPVPAPRSPESETCRKNEQKMRRLYRISCVGRICDKVHALSKNRTNEPQKTNLCQKNRHGRVTSNGVRAHRLINRCRASSSRLLILTSSLYRTEIHRTTSITVQVRPLSFTGHELHLGSATRASSSFAPTLNSVDAFLPPLLCILPCALDWAGIRNPSAGGCR